MSFSPSRFLLCGLLLAAAMLMFLPARLAAELVWTPETGWRMEGGALSGLSDIEGGNALALMNKARAAEARGSKGAAISAYKKVAKKYPNSVFAPEAFFRQGKLRQERHQYSAAFEAYQNLLARYPNTPHFNEAVGEQYRIASALADGARPHYWGWLPGFRSRIKAIPYFETVLFNAPYSDYAPLALMNVARGYMREKEPEAAMDALDRMINTYPQSLLAPDAYLQLGKAHMAMVDGPAYDQTSTREATTYFEDFMILFPNDSSIAAAATGLSDMKTMMAESKITIGDFYFKKRQHYTAAKVFYNEAITAYPDSPVAEKAKKRLVAVEAAMEKASKAGPVKKKRFWLF